MNPNNSMPNLANLGLLTLTATCLLVGQILVKKGLAAYPGLSLSGEHFLRLLKAIPTSPFLLMGLAVSAGSTLLWMIALSRLDLSYAVPTLTAIYFLLILLSAIVVFHEHVTLSRWIGAALMVGAIVLMSART